MFNKLEQIIVRKFIFLGLEHISEFLFKVWIGVQFSGKLLSERSESHMLPPEFGEDFFLIFLHLTVNINNEAC